LTVRVVAERVADARGPEIRIKRAYRAARQSDGHRVLVDGIWPRGVTKDRLRVAGWARDLAPSPELRSWFGHDPAKWDEFRRRYARELDDRHEAVAAFCASLRQSPVTLVYAAKDEAHNNAIALKTYLESYLRRTAS